MSNLTPIGLLWPFSRQLADSTPVVLDEVSTPKGLPSHLAFRYVFRQICDEGTLQWHLRSQENSLQYSLKTPQNQQDLRAFLNTKENSLEWFWEDSPDLKRPSCCPRCDMTCYKRKFFFIALSVGKEISMKPFEHTTSDPLEPTLRLISCWVTGLHLLHERLTPLFARPEVHHHALLYLQAFLSDIPRKNGWLIAE